MLKFYRCKICGNLFEVIDDSGAVPICCNKPMTELVAGTSDGAKEKHIPVCVELEENPEAFNNPAWPRTITVRVGELPHPMTEEHSILWIAVLTDRGTYRKAPTSRDRAEAEFLLSKGEKVRAIYAYCNLHGLWVNTLR